MKQRHCIAFKSVFWAAAFVWLLFIPSLLFILPCSAGAQKTAPAHQLFVVLTPGLRADDLTNPLLPTLRLLRSEGAAGWMVCRAARPPDRRQLTPDGRDTPGSLALTLGSGTRALATLERKGKREKRKEEALPTRDTRQGNAKTRYKQESTGERIQDIITPELLRELNRTVDHVVPIGALGDVAHRAGWRTALLGSVQTDETFAMGQLVATDGSGQIDTVSSASIADSTANPTGLVKAYRGIADVSAPYGLRDDVPALVKAATGLDSRFALVVIAFGDLARADRYGSLCLPAQSVQHRANALRALDALISGLRLRLAVRRENARKNANRDAFLPAPRLYLLSPAPALSTNAADRIAPVCLWGDGVPAGTLTSPSTRTSGIVVNTDFLPTMAADWGLPPPRGAIGRPFTVQVTPPAENTASAWKQRHDRLLQSERLKDVYGGLPTGQTLLVLAALWAFRKQKRQFASTLAIVIVALPLGMLLLPSLPFVPGSVWGAGLALTVWTLAFAAFAWRIYPRPHHLRRLLLTLCAVLTLAIVLDLLTGSRLLRAAWMSYSVMETARFYGIGNEYMGVVIGAACILLGCSGKREKGKGKSGAGISAAVSAANPITDEIPAVSSNNSASPLQIQQNLLSPFPFSLFPLLFCLFLLLVLGYNRFGAKVGAIPSVGGALGVELLALWRGRLRIRDVGAVFLVSGLLLGVLVLLDMRHAAGEQSHLARAFAGGGSNIAAIAQRKLSLEGYLLLHSPWSLALLCAAGTFWIVVKEAEIRRWGDKETRRQGNKETGRQKLSPFSFLISPSSFSAFSFSPAAAGLVTGTIVSLLCNDSGVTAAAMIMLFGCAWALIEAVSESTALFSAPEEAPS